MEKKIIRAFAAFVTGLVLAVSTTGTALAQETPVSGTVSSITGERLPGVTVQVRGTNTTTTTDANGKYTISAPSDGVLLFALIGYKGAARNIASRPQIDVAMESAVAVLEPIIVTGYTAQRRADITGSVSSVNVEGAQQQTSTSVLQRLDGRVPGVTVEAGGAPGSRSTVPGAGRQSCRQSRRCSRCGRPRCAAWPARRRGWCAAVPRSGSPWRPESRAASCARAGPPG